jgi:hypothetical protein
MLFNNDVFNKNIKQMLEWARDHNMSRQQTEALLQFLIQMVYT